MILQAEEKTSTVPRHRKGILLLSLCFIALTGACEHEQRTSGDIKKKVDSLDKQIMQQLKEAKTAPEKQESSAPEQ